MKDIKSVCAEKINDWNERPLGKADWCLWAVMALFIYLTMFYGDLKIIYHHSLTFLDTLFSLDMQNFYGNTLASPCYGFGAVYYWMVYAVVAVWNFPVWIITRLTAVEEYAVPCLLWSKLQMVFFLFLALWMLEKILKDFGYGKEKYRFAQFLFASSLMVVMPTIAIAQIDIITTFLILWGIREYLKFDKITWKFLLIFSFAAAMKIFALFLFIPLVLLKEKRILYVVWDMVAGILCILLCLLPYAGRADYVASTSILNDVMVERMFSTGFTGGNSAIPAFLAILVALGIFAYATELKTREEYFYYANWLALAVFAAFFIFIYAFPYWIVLLAPYLAVLVTVRADNQKLNVILEFFISSCISAYYCAAFGVYMTGDTFSDLILPKMGFIPTSNAAYTSLNGSIGRHGLSMYLQLFYMAFAVCLLAFAVINRPKKPGRPMPWHEAAEEPLKFDHGMIYLRLFGMLAFIAGCIYFAYFSYLG